MCGVRKFNEDRKVGNEKCGVFLRGWGVWRLGGVVGFVGFEC